MVDKEIIGQVPKSVRNFRKINKIFNIILCIIILPIVFINIVMFIKSLTNKDTIPSFAGYKFFVVLTGSMEKTLNIGDFIVTKEIKAEELKAEDIISFKEQNTVVTHRIVKTSKIGDEIEFTTKGDNNNVEDTNKVNSKDVEGKYIFKIPGIGKALSFFQSIWGIIILIMIPVISIISSYRKEERINMRRALRKSKRIEYNQKKQSNNN